MELTLDNITYDLWETVRSSIPDSDDIDIRQIREWVIRQRALWIRKDMSNSYIINPSFTQDLGVVDVEPIDSALATSYGISTGNKIFISKLDIPTCITRNDLPCITRVGPVDRVSTKYSYVSLSAIPYSGNGQFNSETIYWSLIDNKIIIWFKTDNKLIGLLNYINVQGVFEDPIAVGNFKRTDGSPAYDIKTSRFPITRDLLVYMKGEIMKVDFKIKALAPQDKSDNSTNNINPNNV